MGGVSVWEIATGKQVLTLEHPGFTMQCAAFAPDGKTVVTNGDFGGKNLSQGLGVWDAKTGRLLADVHDGININHFALTRDGAIVSGAYADGIVRVWKLSPR